MARPGGNAAPGQRPGDGPLRASHADREQVIGTIKDAFVQGRLTADELDTRVDQIYASRTYAELAEVTADIPTVAGLARDPWRATKRAWVVVYAVILPGLLTLVALPGGPGPLRVGKVLTYTAIVYAVFWVLGVSVMVATRLGERSGRKSPPRSAPEAGQ